MNKACENLKLSIEPERRWIAVVGSPRRGGNTELLVDYLIEELKVKNIRTDKFILNSRNISACTGCEQCMKTGTCIIKDDVSCLIDEMKDADGLILASPSYNYNVTAQMKSFLDRTFCLNDYSEYKSRLSPGKKAVVAGVCRGKNRESMGFTIESMSRTLCELGIDVVGVIEYYDTKNLSVADNDCIRGQVAETMKSVT